MTLLLGGVLGGGGAGGGNGHVSRRQAKREKASKEWMSARPRGGTDKTPAKAAKAVREPPQVLFVESAAADGSDDEVAHGAEDPDAEADKRAAAATPSNVGMDPPKKSALVLRRGDIRGVTGGGKEASPARQEAAASVVKEESPARGEDAASTNPRSARYSTVLMQEAAASAYPRYSTVYADAAKLSGRRMSASWSAAVTAAEVSASASKVGRCRLNLGWYIEGVHSDGVVVRSVFELKSLIEPKHQRRTHVYAQFTALGFSERS